MIVELLLLPLWAVVDLAISVFPQFTMGAYNFITSSELLRIGLFFLPDGFWSVFLSSVIFWLTANFGWAIIEWIYKKIPGIS